MGDRDLKQSEFEFFSLVREKELEKYFNDYPNGDIDEMKLLWRGAAAFKIDENKPILSKWGLSPVDYLNVPDSRALTDAEKERRDQQKSEFARFLKLLQERIEGKFTDVDRRSSYDEYKDALSRIQNDKEEERKLKNAREFEKLRLKYANKLKYLAEIRENLRKYGVDKSGMKAFWEEGGEKNKNASGLAAMRYFERTDYDKGGQPICLQCYGLDNDKPEIMIYGDAIFAGFFNIDRLYNKNVKSAADQWLPSLILERMKYKNEEEKDIANRKNVMLAAQQLAIQKFGGMTIKGGRKYIDEAIDVAVRNGTWRYISDIQCVTCKNPEKENEKFRKKLERAALNQAGIDTLWSKISKTPLRSDISVVEAEREIRSSITGMITVLMSSDNVSAEVQSFSKKYSKLLNLDRGYLIDKIIEMKNSKEFGPGNDFVADMDRLISLVEKKEKGLVEQVRQHAQNKALSRNTLETGQTRMEPDNPAAIILLNALGMQETNSVQQIRSVLNELNGKLSSYLESEQFKNDNDKNLRQRIEELEKNIAQIISDPDLSANPNHVLAKAEFMNYNGNSLSGEIMDISRIMDRDGVRLEIAAVNFADIFGPKGNRIPYDSFGLRGWRDSMLDSKKNVRLDMNGSRQHIGKQHTAAGDVLVVRENGSAVPMGLVASGVAVSMVKKSGLQANSEFARIVDSQLGGIIDKAVVTTTPEKAQKPEQDINQKEKELQM